MTMRLSTVMSYRSASSATTLLHSAGGAVFRG
jgi:hypothetical protein